MITQDGSEQTFESKSMGGSITSPSEFCGDGRSLDYLQGVRRLAERDRRLRDVTQQQDLIDDGADEETVTLGSDGASQSQRDADILIDVSFAHPPSAPFTMLRIFASHLTLLRTETTCLRDAGRLSVVVPAETALVSKRVSV